MFVQWQFTIKILDKTKTICANDIEDLKTCYKVDLAHEHSVDLWSYKQ